MTELKTIFGLEFRPARTNLVLPVEMTGLAVVCIAVIIISLVLSLFDQVQYEPS